GGGEAGRNGEKTGQTGRRGSVAPKRRGAANGLIAPRLASARADGHVQCKLPSLATFHSRNEESLPMVSPLFAAVPACHAISTSFLAAALAAAITAVPLTAGAQAAA